MRKVLFGLIVLASVVVAGWMIVLDRQNRLHWDHWDVVKPGILYRSGQLTSTQLIKAVGRYGIRTVVNFQLPGREMEAERTLAGKLGIGFVNLPMPGDGFGEECNSGRSSRSSTTQGSSGSGVLGPGRPGWLPTQVSGKEVTSPPPPPLRTARESFPSCSSSLSNALCRTRLSHI